MYKKQTLVLSKYFFIKVFLSLTHISPLLYILLSWNKNPSNKRFLNSDFKKHNSLLLIMLSVLSCIIYIIQDIIIKILVK